MSRIEWKDIAEAARQTSEDLAGKDWVQAGIKARVLLAALADEVAALRVRAERAEVALLAMLPGFDELIRDGGGQYDEWAARRDAGIIREALGDLAPPPPGDQPDDDAEE